MEEAAIFFILLLCLVLSVIALLAFCKVLQHVEKNRFKPKYSSIHDPTYKSLSETNLEVINESGPSGSGVATAAAGGYIILPIGRHHENQDQNSRGRKKAKKSSEKPDYAEGGDEMWTRKDSQNEGSFADRTEDPWVCRHDSGKSGSGIVVAASVPAPSSKDKDKEKAKEEESKQEKSAPAPEKLEGSTKNPEEEILYDEDGNPIVNPKSKLNDLTIAGPVVTGEGLISTIATVEPAPAAAPKFSTVGFWEAQEAAKQAEKYGGGSDSYNNYGGGSNYESGTRGYGNDYSGAGGDSSYGGLMEAEKSMNGGWGDSSDQQ